MKGKGRSRQAILAAVTVLAAAQAGTAYASTGPASESGVQTGAWIQEGQDWKYQGTDGTLKTGWVKTESGWYYLDPQTGRMMTGWITVDGRRTATASMRMDSGSMKMERSRPVRIEVTRAARQQTATEAAYQEAVQGIPAVPAAAIRGALEATVIPEITVILEITVIPGMTEIRMAEMPEITETLKIQTSRRWFRW